MIFGDVLCFPTDVAALACGREFLVSSSRELLDTMMHLLGDMKPGLCNKFKVYVDFFCPFQMKCIILQCSSSDDSSFPTPPLLFHVEKTIFGSSFASNIPCRYTKFYPGFVSLGMSLKHHNIVKVSRGALL